jgi:hypothetical protein
VLACGLVLPTTAVFAAKDETNEENKSPTVTSPKGGESWKTGTSRVIKWSKGSGFNFVKIQLLKSGKHALWVSKKTKNDGKHPWKIPATIATGSAYKIKITATTDNKLTDTSNKNFTITKTGGGGSSLSVTTPNGGQKWKTGKKYALKWNKGNAGAHVKIQLLKSGKHSLWISKKTKNDGRYTWTIPSSVATGSVYKVKITSTSKSTVKDESNSTFTITKSGGGGGSIAVTTPNGGESWITGKSYAIKWNKGSAGSFVKIELLKSDSVATTIKARTHNDGKYVWKIPNTVTTDGAYKIKITASGNTALSDSSNSNFTITNEGSYCNETLKITNPKGGEIWRGGKEYEITWCSKAGEAVKIRLMKQAYWGRCKSQVVLINDFTDNDGSYMWKIPDSIPARTTYCIRIDFWGIKGTGVSNEFTIYP